ncbi:hypothetical protein PF005_g17856 [Phytophthora fragariae]|uniref:Uncharacterized protein n=1 Tax=Phytophthora fragariae TaxID=53985 RepID=A0A6A3JDZ9_9STRA|nr:hypothetical protein PF003_g15637 [Phytophthora fragariae]KAE8993359.1 hypothetical protein PF011_g17170 [Phytophthora fragariae]KAE9094345.1 hypothetical protein PF010_g17141 [Phytophthora fragariae]KAE9194006.1 hypothetical protein PF005_g17856 [Phytophthora fragariae]KAE9209989.1 hypothetical protein PF002_g18950 [Phytophthora fragariae]
MRCLALNYSAALTAAADTHAHCAPMNEALGKLSAKYFLKRRL